MTVQRRIDPQADMRSAAGAFRNETPFAIAMFDEMRLGLAVASGLQEDVLEIGIDAAIKLGIKAVQARQPALEIAEPDIVLAAGGYLARRDASAMSGYRSRYHSSSKDAA